MLWGWQSLIEMTKYRNIAEAIFCGGLAAVALGFMFFIGVCQLEQNRENWPIREAARRLLPYLFTALAISLIMGLLDIA